MIPSPALNLAALEAKRATMEEALDKARSEKDWRTAGYWAQRLVYLEIDIEHARVAAARNIVGHPTVKG